MQRGRFYDVPGGDTMLLDLVDPVDNYRLPTFRLPEDKRLEWLHGIKHIQCRDDDIIFNAYPKCGTNWLWEMVNLVLRRRSKVLDEDKMYGMLEAQSIEDTEKMPSRRILNTHLRPSYLPKDAIVKGIKQVLIVRNPKDVLVSHYHHTTGFKLYEYSGNFDNYCKMAQRGDGDFGSYPKYLLDWQNYIRNSPAAPIYTLYYENLKRNGFDEMKKLCTFLGEDIDDSLLKEIVDNCSFDKMKVGKEAVASEATKETAERITNNGYSLLRKGEVGSWKQSLTVAQNEEFDAWWAEEAKDLDMFTFTYT